MNRAVSTPGTKRLNIMWSVNTQTLWSGTLGPLPDPTAPLRCFSQGLCLSRTPCLNESCLSRLSKSNPTDMVQSRTPRVLTLLCASEIAYVGQRFPLPYPCPPILTQKLQNRGGELRWGSWELQFETGSRCEAAFRRRETSTHSEDSLTSIRVMVWLVM